MEIFNQLQPLSLQPKNELKWIKKNDVITEALTVGLISISCRKQVEVECNEKMSSLFRLQWNVKDDSPHECQGTEKGS